MSSYSRDEILAKSVAGWLPATADHPAIYVAPLFGLDRTLPARRFDPDWHSVDDLQDLYDAGSEDA